MTGDGGTEDQWPDLPEDLLGVIYRRCSSSFDRARFAAVCTSWRAIALWNPKLPTLPLLVPSTGNDRRDREVRAYSPEEGRVLRSLLTSFPWGDRIVGSHEGGWIAAAAGPCIAIMNLFTGARLKLSPRQKDFSCTCPYALETIVPICFQKVIFSEDPASEGCTLAAITTDCVIALCRINCPVAGWKTRGCGADTLPYLRDIVFSKGDLYGLSYDGLLYMLHISLNKDDGSPFVTSFSLVTIERPVLLNDNMVVDYDRHIFELGGKLATAVELRRIASSQLGSNFRVFELAHSDKPEQYHYTWVEVMSLGDHALFLAPRGCCKLVHVSSGMRGEVKANHIYYSQRIHSPVNCEEKGLARLNLGSCVVYCSQGKGGTINSRGYHYKEIDDYGGINNGYNSCMWIFPPQF